MSDEHEKTMSLAPPNSAASALSLFHRSSKRQSGVPVELRGSGRGRVTLSRHFCFDPGVAKPSLSPLRARRAQALSVPFRANRYPRWGCDEPHPREIYFAQGDINGFDFLGRSDCSKPGSSRT